MTLAISEPMLKYYPWSLPSLYVIKSLMLAIKTRLRQNHFYLVLIITMVL